MYQYKMVQVPPNIQVTASAHKGNEAAAYLEDIINKMAREGWEFYRIDSVGVDLKQGCLSAFFGPKSILTTYYVISFRKPI